MDLKKVQYLVYALGAALFLMILPAYWLRSWALGLIALGLCVAIVTVQLVLWRCPHCGQHPGRIDGKPKFCPHCGKKLDDFE